MLEIFRRFPKKIHRSFWSFQSRIIISFLGLFLLPLFIIMFFMDSSLEAKIEEKINLSVLNILDADAAALDDIVEKMMTAAAVTSMTDNIIRVLKSPEDYPGYEKEGIVNDFLSNMRNTYLYGLESEVTLVDFNSHLYTTWNRNEDEYDKFCSNKWYKEILAANGRMTYVYHTENFAPVALTLPANSRVTFSIGRMVDDFINEKYFGVVLVSIYDLAFDKIFNDLDSGNNPVMLINEYGDVIYTSEKSQRDQQFDENILAHIFSNTCGSINEDINGVRTIINYTTTKNANWKLVTFMPYDENFREINSIRLNNSIAQICLFCFFLSIIYILSKKLTQPLTKLRDEMGRVGEENLREIVIESRVEEINDLVDEYNKMIRRRQLLLENINREHKQKEELRFRALQAQINPHFIFNTLNNIKFVAYMSNAKEAANMIIALGKILEESIGHSSDIIPLAKEIEYLESYIYLQKIRYNELFSVTWDITEEAAGCTVFKFILQPIAENCIYHGLKDNGENCNILISAFCDDKYLHIKVHDNGAGMNLEKLTQLRLRLESYESSISKGHIGLKNIHDRIGITFGSQYGIMVESVENEGTSVEMAFPKVKYLDGGVSSSD